MGAVLRGGCRQEPGCGSLRDKFFRFLAFREGEDSELTTRPSGLRSGPSGVIEVGDSGDELGDVSMMIGESKVELLVESGSGDASEGYRAVVVVVVVVVVDVVVDDVDVEEEVPVLGAAALVEINLGFLSCSAVESRPDLLYASCRFE
ncbi:TPA_exp: hypothetical protein A8136_4363 [Trichophyton benhamiae CBS 112371]|nr:TPA_exp: hypothetical protein A8136_4363 [Trichophyton benhamiae CBS 112371]